MLLLLLSTAQARIPTCRDLAGEQPVHQTERVGLLRSTLWVGLRFYQRVISPADGAGCTMYPSCSRYGMQAVSRDGPLVGTWLTAARILRPHSDPHYPVCRANGRLFHYNPPGDDEWWR